MLDASRNIFGACTHIDGNKSGKKPASFHNGKQQTNERPTNPTVEKKTSQRTKMPKKLEEC